MIYTLDNIYKECLKKSPISISRIFRSRNKWKKYELDKGLTFQLSNGEIIEIKRGFQWDLSSSPRIFWAILPPDGDFIVGALIHDYLYQHKMFTRKFADKEMLLWSKAVNGTRKISLQKMDNYTRFFFVRLFGWIVWKKEK